MAKKATPKAKKNKGKGGSGSSTDPSKGQKKAQKSVARGMRSDMRKMGIKV